MSVCPTPGTPGACRAGPVGLVFPIPGAPLSAEQIEERTSTLPDGTSVVEIVQSKSYRDSAGRLRVESESRGESGELLSIATLLDPVARTTVSLLNPGNLAILIKVPESGAFGFSGVGQALPAGKWKTATENLGTRAIDGVDCEGQRTIHTSEDEPLLTASNEQWFCKELGLMASAASLGPTWSHTATLRVITRSEPDPALFVVPPDYNVTDFSDQMLQALANPGAH